VELLKPSDVSKILNVSSSMVYKLEAAGKIPSVRFSVTTDGKRRKEVVRFHQEDIEKFIADNYSIT